MSFIAKNPISAAEVTSSPSPPQKGARGVFAKEDGWYDIDSEGNASKLVTEDNIPSTHPAKVGDVETAIVLNDVANNHALAPSTTASGTGAIAGIKGYFFSAIDFEGEEILDESGAGTGTYRPQITLTKEQPDDITKAPIPEPFEIGFAVGDELTITNDSKYPRCCKITVVNNNVITVDALPFKTVINMREKLDAEGKTDEKVGVDDYQIFCPDRPLAGEVNLGFYAHAEGEETWALERASHAEGRLTRAEGQYAHVEGRETTALYIGHAEGKGTFAGAASHAEGLNTIADGGQGAHSEGVSTHAAGMNGSHAEGYKSIAGTSAHAEGVSTKANAKGSHTEGYYNDIAAEAEFAHAENYRNEITPEGLYSHAEGMDTTIKAKGAHTEGLNTIASSEWQHVQGKYNVEDTNGDYADIIGGGTGTKTSQRKNIQTTDWSGNLWTAGDIYLGGTSQDDKNAKKVAVETCINSSIDASSEIQLEICDNCILSYGAINTSLITTLPEEYQYIGFTSGLYFTTPSVIPENYTRFDDKIYFKGDSTQRDGTKSTFVPEADMRYTIVFSFDGNMVNGYVSGVPAPPVSEVTE